VIIDIIMPLAAGLAMFLFGMKVMELALHRWAGPHLKMWIERTTHTPLRGLAVGTIVTALLQSSSAITVITIGLVNARLIDFSRTLGIILGTNIGTCLTTELIGLNIGHYGLPMLLTCFPIWLVCSSLPDAWLASSRWAGLVNGLKYMALAICGLAAVLLAIVVMQSTILALQSYGLFEWFLKQAQVSPLWGVVAGAIVTAIIHSSSATIAMTMGLASVHMIDVELGIAIVLGANIGTCATALIAAIGGSRSGQFVAWSHILLNVGGALLFFPLIGALAYASGMLSVSESSQLAHAQTIFNIVCSLIALPICYLPVFRRLDGAPRAR
jgi:phosphate:Na+ symporter